MECKENYLKTCGYDTCGINRNIVECKVVYAGFRTSFVTSINRNIVECKDAVISNLQTSNKVLIETLWNVKSTKIS